MFREVSLLFMLSLLDVGQGTWQDPAEEGDAKNIYICESFPPGETVMTLLTDTEATFHIHTDSTGALEMFEIIGNELKIKDTITEDQLDYEGDSPFRNIEITLVATDKDTSGEVSIDCTIYNEDDNDNEPVFKGSPPYTKSIRDTPSAGDFVYQVEATDADGSSDNNQITYSFKDEYPIFKIDANSGTISLTDSVADSPLERGNEYQLIVIGTDSNPETPLSSEVNLTVRVGSPVTWTDPAEGDAQNIYMCESFTAGEVLMELLAEDPDEDKLTFTIDPASEEALKYFEIVDGNKLAIKSDVNMSNLDYEGEKNFREVGITLLVSDDVYDPVPIDCKIINEDSNDNPPVFAPEPPYTQTIRESLSVDANVDSAAIKTFEPDTAHVVISKQYIAVAFEAQCLLAACEDRFCPEVDNLSIVFLDLETKFVVQYSKQKPLIMTATSPNNQLSYILEGGDGKFSIDADGLITLADGAVIAEGETYTLTIAATDNNPDEPLSAEAVLTVTVEAKAAPQFVFPDPDDVDECKIYICESAQADEVFLTFAATDEDTDDETLTYNIDQSEESVKALFEVDGKNLKVRTEISENYFDYEAESPTLEYPVSIEVSDGSTSTQLETKVCVEDWNDNAPEFEGDFTKTIIDATAGGDAVLVVTATDKDGTPENNQVTLTMEDSDTFNFDSGTKTISVKDGVTFDVDTKSEYTVTIVAEDSALEDTLTTRQTYTINIGTAPVFQNPDPEDKDECNLYIRELTQVDETFATLAATDKTPPNGEFTFSMDKSSDDVKALFKIEGNELKVKSSEADFDYEKKDVVLQYTIQLMVSDGMFSSEMTATICVEDDNDHAPVFEDTDYKASILEEAPAGTTLLTVSATDDDGTPAYNQVTYSLSGTGSENFKINPSTGIITLAADSSLDFTTTPKYTLTVTASDNVPDDEKTATKEVKIDILTGPKIENLQSPKTVSIDENVDDKYIISTLDVLDEDDVGSVSVSIETESKNAEGLFTVDGFDVKKKASTILDAETSVGPYELTFRATDGTHDDVSAMLTININDVNDNKPVFTQKNPTAIIGETADIGYVVTTVAATDADISNPSNEMFYSLSGDGSDDFNIDNSGKVTVAAALNFKSKKVYSLTVTAEDSDTNPQTETTALTINLKTGPKFTEPVDGDTLTIKETKTSNGAVVKQLTATDEDGDTALTFEVISQSPENPTMFEIEDANLLMSDAVDVDEVGAVTEYALRLKVSDGRLYTENNVITVTVDILDSNEPPTFDQSKISTILKEWEKEGDTVYTIKAKDVDITESFGQSSLKYSMTGTPHLEIDPDTGEIKVAPGVELDFSVNEKYTVIVTATDGGGLKDSIEIFFQVVTGPVFNAPMDKEEIKIAEKDTKKDAIVYVLTTSDKDNDAEMTIEIVEQAPTEPKMFHIINNNQLVITEDVDADAQNAVLSYDITLKVSDAKDDTRDSSITVTIKIEDSNDEPPIFEKEKYSTEVTDSSKPGTIVITVTATDKDITDVYSTLHYVLSQASDDADDFTVNKTSGAVAVAKGLDYDRKKSYSITLLTVDGTTDPLSDGTTIDIKIVTAPQFENLKEEMTAEVDENSAKNTIVYKLQISDKDQTAEGTSITTTIYSQTPDEGLFELDGLTLKTSRTGLDAEKQQTYTLIFRANDGKHETTSANLTVKVKDKNDEYPKFVRVEDVTIEENKATSGLESEIIVIKANDEDVTNPNNKLAYSITDGNDENLFAIDSDTGIMRLVKTPVSMTKSEHTLTIKAVDGGLPKLEASTSVKIIINDKIVEECTSTLCKNGATCMSFVNAYSCKCVLGFDGTQCENNINDCTQDSCKNDGQCIDGINSFMCDCQEGWTGSTCTEACNNNKYGRNCAKPCSCNENGLGNVGSQMCHVQNGDCFCNPHWRGKECDRDIDECEENLHNCNSAANKICNNTFGGHSCVCQQGFNENNNGSCTRRPPAEVILGVGEFPVTIVIRINIPRPCPNLRNPSVYRSEESRIIKLILGRTVAVRVIVHFISCGSLVYEATVVVNNTESAKAELANDLQNIRDDGILNLDGENVTVTNLTVENREVTPLSQSSGGMEERVCSVYTSYIQCASDEKCKYENGVASCKIVAVDNLTLILGLGLGLLLPLLLGTVVAITAWFVMKRAKLNKRKQRKRYDMKSSFSGERQFPTRYYDNARYSNSSLYSLSEYHDMPAVDVVKYGQHQYRY